MTGKGKFTYLLRSRHAAADFGEQAQRETFSVVWWQF